MALKKEDVGNHRFIFGDSTGLGQNVDDAFSVMIETMRMTYKGLSNDEMKGLYVLAFTGLKVGPQAGGLTLKEWDDIRAQLIVNAIAGYNVVVAQKEKDGERPSKDSPSKN